MAYTTISPSSLKVNTILSGFENDYIIENAFDTTKPVTGNDINNGWRSQLLEWTNARINIDLGSTYTIKNIKYVNLHNHGLDVRNGARDFKFYGSNHASVMHLTSYNVFDHLTLIYEGIGFTDPTDLSTTNGFKMHTSSDIADYQNIWMLGNTYSFRYYVILILNNWSGVTNIGIRRIELQVSV